MTYFLLKSAAIWIWSLPSKPSALVSFFKSVSASFFLFFGFLDLSESWGDLVRKIFKFFQITRGFNILKLKFAFTFKPYRYLSPSENFTKDMLKLVSLKNKYGVEPRFFDFCESRLHVTVLRLQKPRQIRRIGSKIWGTIVSASTFS